ncbi:MAG: hypothetical protein JO249_06385, partial [Acidobacteria bacterium]|nr:hypothetical protein [Acidobacteriota bacterium]
MSPERSVTYVSGRTERRGMSISQSYDEIIDFLAASTTPDALVPFRPSEETTQRVEQLVEKSKEGTISVEEQSELDDYLQLE